MRKSRRATCKKCDKNHIPRATAYCRVASDGGKVEISCPFSFGSVAGLPLHPLQLYGAAPYAYLLSCTAAAAGMLLLYIRCLRKLGNMKVDET